jgi:hypothetical protein
MPQIHILLSPMESRYVAPNADAKIVIDPVTAIEVTCARSADATAKSKRHGARAHVSRHRVGARNRDPRDAWNLHNVLWRTAQR